MAHPHLRRPGITALLLIAAPLWIGSQSAPPPGITRTVLIDNDTVLVARLRLAPGAREEPHTHPFSAVVFQLDAGRVDMQLGTARATTLREPGFTEFIAREVRHAAANVGSRPFDVVTVAIKPGRRPAPEAPPTAARPGITRTPVLENDETRVVRVEFSPGSAEPTHSHPFDLVLVQLTPARMTLQVGDVRTVKDDEAGSALFLPRDVPHAVASADSRPFRLMSVTIK